MNEYISGTGILLIGNIFVRPCKEDCFMDSGPLKESAYYIQINIDSDTAGRVIAKIGSKNMRISFRGYDTKKINFDQPLYINAGEGIRICADEEIKGDIQISLFLIQARD